MTEWIFYPAFLATLISVLGLSHLAYTELDEERLLPLSLLAVSRPALLTRFRIILLTCGSLFAITMYWFVVPKIDHALWILVAWSAVYFCEVVLAIVPARKDSFRSHALFAQAMAVAMLALAFLFSWSLHGTYANIELLVSLAMSSLLFAGLTDKMRFLVYELLFIFLSHASILVAVVALR